MVVFAQKRVSAFSNPFWFGTVSFLLAGSLLLCIALWMQTRKSHGNAAEYLSHNLHWFALAASGLVMLNVFLFLLFTQFGAGYYTLYAVLAILSTSVGVGVWLLQQPMNGYYWMATAFAIISIVFFVRGSAKA